MQRRKARRKGNVQCSDWTALSAGSPSQAPGLNITESHLADFDVAKAEKNSNLFQQSAVGTANPMKEWN